MQTTYRKHRTLTTKVTEAQYQQLLALMNGRPPSEWIRDLLLAQLTVEPTLRVLLEEQLAANYIQESLLHAIASGTKATVEDTRRLIATAHRKKTTLADEALGKARRSA
jgi:hypothetical protein